MLLYCLWLSLLASTWGGYLREEKISASLKASVIDVTGRYTIADLGTAVFSRSVLEDLSSDEEDHDPVFFVLESRQALRNATFTGRKVRWNPALIGSPPSFSVPSGDDTNVYYIRYRLADAATSQLVMGLSNTILSGPEFGMTGCFLFPDGNLISSSLGAARVGFTPQLHGGDIVDWIVEVEPDVTINVWLVVNGAPKGLAFSLDFGGDVGVLASLQPAIAFTGSSNGDTAVVVLFKPISMHHDRLMHQPYRQFVSRRVDDSKPWLGHWEVAVSDDSLFSQARKDNVDIVIGVAQGTSPYSVVVSCSVLNTASTVLLGAFEEDIDHWFYVVRTRSPLATTKVEPPESLALYEAACSDLLLTIKGIAYQQNILGLYWRDGKMALVRAVQKVTPFRDDPFVFATS